MTKQEKILRGKQRLRNLSKSDISQGHVNPMNNKYAIKSRSQADRSIQVFKLNVKKNKPLPVKIIPVNKE